MAISKERKPAPPVAVDEVFRDDRAAILADLDASNPDFVHSFQRGGSNVDELQRKNMEVVKNESGSEVLHESDIVVRVPRAVHERRRTIESARSFESAKRILAGKDESSLRQMRSPKKIKVRKEEEE